MTDHVDKFADIINRAIDRAREIKPPSVVPAHLEASFAIRMGAYLAAAEIAELIAPTRITVTREDIDGPECPVTACEITRPHAPDEHWRVGCERVPTDPRDPLPCGCDQFGPHPMCPLHTPEPPCLCDVGDPPHPDHCPLHSNRPRCQCADPYHLHP